MTFVFLNVLRISLTAALAAVVVIIARFLLKGAPRWITCLLWAFVALRLLCPVLPESELSIVPDKVYYAEDVAFESMQADLAALLNDAESYKAPLPVEFDKVAEPSADTHARIMTVCGYVWLGGASLMMLYSLISYLRMKYRFADAVLYKDNIRMSEKVASPFVMGFVAPQIYIPFDLDKKTCKQVLLHEQAHIKRFDHISKPLGFVLLCLHWFNPLMWIAYILFCRDVEVACDEKVIKNYKLKQKKAYAMALLKCKMPSRLKVVYPIAFGETSVGTRIKKTLRYRRPAAVIAVFAVVLTLSLSLCLLTDPVSAASDNAVRNYSSTRVTEEYVEAMEAVTEPTTQEATQPTTQLQTEPRTQSTESYEETYEDDYEDDYEDHYQDYSNDYSDDYSEDYSYESDEFDPTILENSLDDVINSIIANNPLAEAGYDYSLYTYKPINPYNTNDGLITYNEYGVPSVKWDASPKMDWIS